jgi:coenzyme PQQ precursor peptide PqqA
VFRSAQKYLAGGRAMWKKPKVVEIAVGMEINSYACAIIA